MKLKDGERIDELHRNGYKLIQNPAEFCFGIDAVILSGFARVKRGECVLDLGTGTGVIPILLEAKTQGAHFTGLEIQPQMVDMARRSVALNGLEEKVTIIEGDIKKAKELFAGRFQVVTSNPPYMNQGGGLINPDDNKAIARHEVKCTLEDVIKAAQIALKQHGRFYMVHRPHRLTDIFVLFRQHGLEPKCLQMVHPHENKPPTMVLVEAVKGGRPLLKTEPPLVVYKSEGGYTDEILRIYND